MTAPLLSSRAHVAALLEALPLLDTDVLDDWGRRLADVLVGGGRLLVAGNGGSAAQAQHLTAELVGRYRDDRPPFSAICLTAEMRLKLDVGGGVRLPRARYPWDRVAALTLHSYDDLLPSGVLVEEDVSSS